MGWDRNGDDWGMMGNDGFSNHFNSGYGIFMGIFFVLFVALLVWIFYRIGKLGKHGSVSSFGGKESPKEILDRRLANGEVSVEDYEKAKNALGIK
jgi:putative membrane protein